MKTKIHSLHDALSYLTKGLYYAETKLIHDFAPCCNSLTAPSLKKEIEKYTSSSNNKLLKLERMFNYLMTEPAGGKSEVIDKLLEETKRMLTGCDVPHLRDQLAIGCIQSINAYKVTNYRAAYMFAIELELDAVADLVQEILEWETINKKIISKVAIEIFNDTNRTTTN
jgi:ferritin-like metal-binding protein YciE